MLTAARHRLRADEGFTAVELLVVILLMGVIGSAATTSLVKGMQTTAATQVRFEALAELQKTVDRVTRELRAAEPIEFAASSSTQAVATVYRNEFSEQLRFTYVYCPVQERLHVRREGPVPAPTGPVAAIDCATTTLPVLIDDVSNGGQPVFDYLTVTGAPATSVEDLFQVRVTVIRDLNGQSPIEVTTTVRVRNA